MGGGGSFDFFRCCACRCCVSPNQSRGLYLTCNLAAAGAVRCRRAGRLALAEGAHGQRLTAGGPAAPDAARRCTNPRVEEDGAFVVLVAGLDGLCPQASLVVTSFGRSCSAEGLLR